MNGYLLFVPIKDHFGTDQKGTMLNQKMKVQPIVTGENGVS